MMKKGAMSGKKKMSYVKPGASTVKPGKAKKSKKK